MIEIRLTIENNENYESHIIDERSDVISIKENIEKEMMVDIFIKILGKYRITDNRRKFRSLRNNQC
jgi:hypothetical protein